MVVCVLLLTTRLLMLRSHDSIATVSISISFGSIIQNHLSKRIHDAAHRTRRRGGRPVGSNARRHSGLMVVAIFHWTGRTGGVVIVSVVVADTSVVVGVTLMTVALTVAVVGAVIVLNNLLRIVLRPIR